MPNINPKRVFSSRVANYIKYHPGYPIEVINTLIKECRLVPNWHVADTGSETGLLARLFLDFGCTVIGVEPNEEMRLAGDHILANYSGFRSLPGSADDAEIADAGINLVSAGMPFHWFDAPRARDEFRRILTPGGWAALVWHRMLTGPDSFMQSYTSLIHKYSPGFKARLSCISAV